MKTITINLPPLLYQEIYEHTVETGLVDHRSGNKLAGLKPEDVSLYEKIETGPRLECSLAEAHSLYNELYNLEDLCEQWAEEIGLQYYGVLRSIKANKKKLLEYGVKVNERGWARQ
jgi:hypothetical protein